MADAISLARQVSAESEDPFLIGWAEHLEEFVAKQALYLAPRADLMSESLRAVYLDTLQEMFRLLSDTIQIEVSGQLLEALERIAPPDTTESIRRHVLLINGA